MPWFFQGLIVFILLKFYLENKSIKLKKLDLTKLYLIGITVFSLGWVSFYIYRNFEKPHEWDFLCWYLDGHVAVSGLNFYEPKSYQEVFKQIQVPYKPSDGFISEIVNVGFKYPPPTMIYLVPLGFFNYFNSHLMWTVFNILLMIANIYLFWEIFFNKKSFKDLLLIIPLFCLQQGTRSNLDAQQNTLILLLMVLLMWKDKNLARAGIWMALGIAAKPIMVLLGLYFLFKRETGKL